MDNIKDRLGNSKFIQIMVFYIILSLALAATGYFVVPRFIELGKMMGGTLGLALGIIVSVVLWFTVGKKMLY